MKVFSTALALATALVFGLSPDRHDSTRPITEEAPHFKLRAPPVPSMPAPIKTLATDNLLWSGRSLNDGITVSRQLDPLARNLSE